MTAVSINTSPGLRVSASRQLWEGEYSSGLGASCGMPGVTSSNYDISPDGRFLMVRDEDNAIAETQIVVVLNWARELRRLIAIK